MWHYLITLPLVVWIVGLLGVAGLAVWGSLKSKVIATASAALSQKASEWFWGYLRKRLRIEPATPAKPEPVLKQVGSANFYFDGDKGPCCQPCYDGQGKLTVLTPPENWNGGVRRQCVLCGKYFYEKPSNWRAGGPPRGGPNDWMAG
jgi:hypothetical protein